jgi:hypothetical protein
MDTCGPNSSEMKFWRAPSRRVVVVGAFIAAAPWSVPAQQISSPHVTEPVAPKTSVVQDLSSIAISAPVRLWKPGDEVQVRGDMVELGERGAVVQPRAKGVDPLLETSSRGAQAAAPVTAPTTVASFNGISATGVLPPDTVGAVGPNHYVQMVNSAFAIWDKTGHLLAGPSPINSLWHGFGGPCETQNNGDPIVRYDHLADRWLVSQFAIDDHMQCIAISRGANPVTSGWFLYAFRTVTASGTEVTPDYPKVSVWPDGYYMSTQRGFPNGGLDVWVFERARMVAGQPARQVTFAVSAPSIVLLPSDLDGPAPPAGTRNFFVRQVDGQRFGGQDRVEVFALSVNWGNPAASTFQLMSTLPVAAFDSVLCQADLMGACVPQPSNAPKLETLTVWPMWRAQYRNFGTYETLVFNHTVDANGADLAGIRWYELRRPTSGAWSIHQQGTHAPDNTVHRWMGSIAMDEAGNIALGYTASSSTLFPSMRVATRLPTDPAGVLAQGEVTLVNGGGSQTFGVPRWGNYSTMDVDPSKPCTFWYTSEVYTSTSQAGWETRVVAFQMPSCGGPSVHWESLGGVLLSDPSCVSWGLNRIDCFARGTDGAMYHRWWNGSAWGGWESLGGIITSEPNCVSWGPNRIDCFARGTNGAMYHRWWNGSAWGGWENLGGIITTAPNCVSWGPNRIDCFARGTNGAMYHRWWNGSAWGGWESLGGIITSAPNCVSWGPNRIDCFARGTNGAMYHRWWDGSAWGGWENLGGTISSDPNCVAWGPNRLDCFALGTDSAMYHRWWNGSQWGGWESLGGILLSRPECVAWGPNRLDCFGVGTDSAMYHRWWNGSQWGGWESLGGILMSRPECVAWGPNRLDCFTIGAADSALYHKWWDGSAWHP